jgi:hypothetical protein
MLNLVAVFYSHCFACRSGIVSRKSGIANRVRIRTLLRIASLEIDMRVDAPGTSRMKKTQGCGRLGRA